MKALVCVSDLHINSTVALAPRIVNLDDGGTYHASRTQCWLWECWRDFCEKAKALSDGYYRIGVFGGDLGELDTLRRSNQLITPNKATIQTMIIDTISPLVDFADACLFLRGTIAHVGKSAWIEESIAQDTDTTLLGENGAHSHYHARRVIDGVRLDISHHASMGSAPWSRRNAANNLAARVMWQYRVEMDEQAPHLVLRSHNHTYATSGDNYFTRVDYLPAWTTKTEYAYRVGYENAISDIGGIVYLCDGGKFTSHKFLYPPKDARRIWKLTI